MNEWRLFSEGEVPHVSTLAYFSQQPRAPHLEQPNHRPRLEYAARWLRELRDDAGVRTFSDLGCGDGGLLQLVDGVFDRAWGYDLQPSSREGWPERGVTAYALDIFGADQERVEFGDVVAMTEVLEHLANPHEALRWVLSARPRFLVASSPHNESSEVHCPEHAWAWDHTGFLAMIEGAGWRVTRHEDVDTTQIVLAVPCGT